MIRATITCVIIEKVSKDSSCRARTSCVGPRSSAAAATGATCAHTGTYTRVCDLRTVCSACHSMISVCQLTCVRVVQILEACELAAQVTATSAAQKAAAPGTLSKNAAAGQLTPQRRSTTTRQQ